MDAGPIEARKARARTWFERLRDDICAAFETLEDELPAGVPFAERPAGRFVRTPWSRTDHIGGQPISGLPQIGTSSAGAAKADPGFGGGGGSEVKGGGVWKGGGPAPARLWGVRPGIPQE